MEELGAGLYEHLVTEALERTLRDRADEYSFELSALEADSAARYIATHIAELLQPLLLRLPARDRIEGQAEIANRLVELLHETGPDKPAGRIAPPPRLLLSAQRLEAATRGEKLPPRPLTPLTECALLVNAPGEPSLGRELVREINSALNVDLLCAFVRWHGVRIVLDALAALVERGGRLRVLTTTYMGATERRAVDALAEIGADIRITYEVNHTRLHAKAWLLERSRGLSTAFIGSSNLSRSALHDGLEWNVRLAEQATRSVFERFRATFDGYWSGDLFDAYDPSRDAERLDEALGMGDRPSGQTIALSGLDVRPYPHQERILEDLEAERARHGHTRNLVVAATGTGKTVVAALDYRRLRQAEGPLSLLFVAHRYEILSQSLSTFRSVLGDGAFGELYVRGDVPSRWTHVFASIQSISALNVEYLQPDQFDVVIVDEFHHAEAPTYGKLLRHLTPRYLLGLTATPERSDGVNVARWFQDRIASELRLWHALEDGILTPFQYFGISDDTDLSGLRWSRGGYDITSLEQVYTGNDARVAKILRALEKKASVSDMRALGFCVSVAHAKYMARRFSEAGIASAAITGDTSAEDRDHSLRALRDGSLKVIFTVDIFNEGVDVPEVDTVIFLRPTESATVFLQQLGRGLRRSLNKTCLTVLDFIGQQHRQFRFDLRYRALTGASRSELSALVEEGFPFLPAGCHVELDPVAQRIVLENVRGAISHSFQALVSELRTQGDVPLGAFVESAGIELDDLYRGNRSYTRLRREAGLLTEPPARYEANVSAVVKRLRHVNDPERLSTWSEWLQGHEPIDTSSLTLRKRRLLEMLRALLPVAQGTLRDWADGLWDSNAALAEMRQLLTLLEDVSRDITYQMDDPEIPLHVHGRYTQDEIMAAIGAHTAETPKKIREGVYFDKKASIDVFWVTLVKAETQFSPTTRYRDYALSPTMFHWESQNKTSPGSSVGKRYINHHQNGSKVWIFVREKSKEPLGDASPYVFLGPARYRSHEGSKPMAIIWELEWPMPPELYLTARTAV